MVNISKVRTKHFVIVQKFHVLVIESIAVKVDSIHIDFRALCDVSSWVKSYGTVIDPLQSESMSASAIFHHLRLAGYRVSISTANSFFLELLERAI